MSKDKGWEYLTLNDVNEAFNSDGSAGWGYKNDDGSGTYNGNDGSYAYQNSDGSSSYQGADGSYGYINSDGSGSYYGADGSYGYINSDGSCSYQGADGSYGYIDSDGNSSYYDADCEHYSRDDDPLFDFAVTMTEAAFWTGAALISDGISKRREAKKQRKEWERAAKKQEKQQGAEKNKESAPEGKGIKVFLSGMKRGALPFSLTELIGSSTDEVVEKFEEAGFTNYKLVADRDLYAGSSESVNDVKEILINGKTNLPEGTSVPYKADILIVFHAKRELVFPYSSKQMLNKNFSELLHKLTEIGFTEVYTFPLNDLKTGWIKKKNTVHRVMVEDSPSIKKGMALEYDKKIIIEYHSFRGRKG